MITSRGDEVDHVMFGPYRLVGLLGHSATATVHRALDSVQDDRPVALKIFEPAVCADPVVRARLHRDAAVLAALRDHPHVPPVHRYGEIDGRFYVDMGLVPGPSLADVLRSGPLHPAREHAIAAQLHAVAGTLRSAGLCHPIDRADVLLSGSPAREVVQLVGVPLGRIARAAPPVVPELVRPPHAPRRHAPLVGAVALAALAVLVAVGLVAVRLAGGA